MIAVPDSSPRLFSISEGHGPSTLETIGIAVLLAGWSLAFSEAWARRRRLATALPPAYRYVAAGLLGLGVGLLVASVFSGYEWWWAVGTAVLVAVQAAALIAVFR